jgi:hypothetical protein
VSCVFHDREICVKSLAIVIARLNSPGPINHRYAHTAVYSPKTHSIMFVCLFLFVIVLLFLSLACVAEPNWQRSIHGGSNINAYNHRIGVLAHTYRYKFEKTLGKSN